jgi:WD40 repeat protein
MPTRRHILTGLVLAVCQFVVSAPALAQVAVYSADSKMLATTHLKEGGIILWDVADGKQRQVLDGPLMHLPSMNFSPDNRWLAAWSSATIVERKAGKPTVRLWDTTTGKQLLEFDDKQSIDQIVMSPDRKSIALVTESGDVLLFPSIEKPQTFATLKLTKAPKQFLRKVSIAYAPDGKILASASWDGTVKLWHVHNGEERTELVPGSKTKTYPLDRAPRLAFAPDGKSLLAPAMGPGSEECVSLWDVAAAAVTLTAKSVQAESLHDLTYSPDGKSQALFVVTNKGPAIILRDVASGKQRLLADVGDDPQIRFVKLEFSPDGGRLLISSRTSQRQSFAKVWDLSSGKLLATIDGGGAKLTSDGNGVVVYRAGGVKVETIRDGFVRWAILERGMVIAPDGQTFFGVSNKGTMSLWDTARSQRRSTLTPLKRK